MSAISWPGNPLGIGTGYGHRGVCEGAGSFDQRLPTGQKGGEKMKAERDEEIERKLGEEMLNRPHAANWLAAERIASTPDREAWAMLWNNLELPTTGALTSDDIARLRAAASCALSREISLHTSAKDGDRRFARVVRTLDPSAEVYLSMDQWGTYSAIVLQEVGGHIVADTISPDDEHASQVIVRNTYPTDIFHALFHTWAQKSGVAARECLCELAAHALERGRAEF
ncbi:MAG: hypothetical protein Q8P82_03170 [bacterium]|nr:hypothetical protein [bacterium]